METITKESVVPLEVARHVLWHIGDTNLGQQPGMFTERLFLLASAADAENLAILEAAFPVYISTWRVVSREPWGLDWLRKRVMSPAGGQKVTFAKSAGWVAVCIHCGEAVETGTGNVWRHVGSKAFQCGVAA
jgi:hypothetical protein